jgi:predicted Zn-dependent protease
MPEWLQHIPSASAIEAALFRTMPLPHAETIYPRPPKESQTELGRLIASTPDKSELYSLRARADEQALDFAAAERDWQAYTTHVPAEKIELADYYHRRLDTAKETAVLYEIAREPAKPEEKDTPASQQQSWKTFERLLALIADQAAPGSNAEGPAYRAFLARYPKEQQVYDRYLHVLLARKDFTAAQSLIADYRRQVPEDIVFPLQASALVELKRGNTSAALAIYDHAFQPLWPSALVQSYFALLAETHRQRDFLDDARARLAHNPDDLNAAARLFFYYQQQAHTDTAQQQLDNFRRSKDARHATWSAVDLDTLAQLSGMTGNNAEVARYDYALASEPGNLPNGRSAAEAGLSGLIHLLLTAPEQPIALGAGNLTMYRDIATLDQGPGYWNGILSLWLNGTSPEQEYSNETQQARPYFHRAKAAELLATLDQRFPAATSRPGLHASMIAAYASYGESASVIAAGKSFLAVFPKANEREQVVSAMADAYARQNDTTDEFALYESVLDEMPSFLDRYVGRLVATKQAPRALTVLRRQLDRDPNDPARYERLATFLEQNNLGDEQEQVYKLAIAKFQGTGWDDKLARLYLRRRNRQAFAALTRQVTDTFRGSDLDTWFEKVSPSQPLGPALALQLNLYAHQRFPHDIVFTRNLLNAYLMRGTADPAAREALLRASWWQSPEFRNEFFTELSSSGQLDAELAALEPLATEQDPAASRELAEVHLWSSHFEQSAPLLGTLVQQYPADTEVGDTAASIFRSLAYYDAANTTRAAAIERNLLLAEPDNEQRIETLGDMYAEAKNEGRDDLPMATPIVKQIPKLHPGSPQGYLQAATFFWDYFEFDDALDQIRQARTRFAQPALYGFEAGVIQEGRRDMPAAIAEYAAVSLSDTPPPAPVANVNDAQPSSDYAVNDTSPSDNSQNTGGQDTGAARDRLLHLAHRRDTATQVDQATAALAKAHLVKDDPLLLAAVSLRADVLLAQHREAELPPLLEQAIALATTTDQAAAVAALAQAKSQTAAFVAVEEHALERQIVLATDPVQKLELQYSLAGSYEARKDITDAERLVEAIHTANPRILGVVRATTDFYGRTAQPRRAIATLLDAAGVANHEYAPQFQLEAAQKANDAADYTQARGLANSLLAQSPYDARYIDVIAQSYARAGDDAALKQFYLTKLDAVRTAQLTPDERKQDTALLRRGLIPALTRLHDYQGALDQYIALISAFPEDADTAQQAALYAIRYRSQPYLLAFLNRTAEESPRDSRFAILLAQVQTTFENLPAAIDAYNRAIAIRKDRADLYIAKAELEVRLDRLDEAAQDYQRIYILSYRDPQWMVQLAQLRARQQRPADAVKALEAAWITGRPPQAANSFEVAEQLAQWNLLAEARSFAEQGVAQLGPDLLTAANGCNRYGGSTCGPRIYARIMTRLGHPAIALATLEHARQQANDPAFVDAEIRQMQQGTVGGPMDADSVAAWRKHLLATRRAAADNELRQCLNTIGEAIRTYATPEQKLQYAALLDQRHPAEPELWTEAASAAGLLDRETAWLKQTALAPAPGNRNAPETSDAARYRYGRSLRRPALSEYTSLETSRLQFNDLATTLEAAAKLCDLDCGNGLRSQAAGAWRKAGNDAEQLRLYQSLPPELQIDDHFFGLLLRRNLAAFIALAGSSNTALADAAANYAVAHSNPAVAQQAIDARAAALSPLWKASTTALAGLYLTNGRANPTTDAAFHQALADGTIAERLARPTDPAQQLAGSIWFYYGSRYGAYRAATGSPDAEDYLPAALESTPSSPGAYLNLARTYAESSNTAAAVVEYQHALELAGRNPAIAATVEDEIAVLEWRGGHKDEAITHWKAALAALYRVQDESSAPESFWTTFALVTHHLRQRALTVQLRPEIDAILRPYLARNGNYRSTELLRDIFVATATPANADAGASWIIELTANAGDNESYILNSLTEANWLPLPARELLFARLLQLDAAAKPANPAELQAAKLRLVRLYLANGQMPQAESLFRTVANPNTDATVQPVRILLAAHTGKLAALIAPWQADPDAAPANDILTQAAATLTLQKDLAGARLLLEFVYDSKQRSHSVSATDLLALAQSRLDIADLTGAIELLDRLSLMPAEAPPSNDSGDDSSNNPGQYANIDSAARLLEAAAHPAEALPFLNKLVKDVPWNASYRLRLAQAEQASKSGDATTLFTALAKDATAPYALRIEAAKALAASGASGLGSAELNLLASASITPAQARQPYFVAARLAAAKASPDQRIPLLHEAIAIDIANPRARLDLTVAEANAGQFAQALATYLSIEVPELQSRHYVYDDPTQASQVSALDLPENPNPPAASLPAIAANDDAATRLALAETVANLYARNGQTSIELTYLQLAQNLKPTPDRHKEMLRLEALVELAHKNTNRRPVIHAALDQALLVEPRQTLAQMQAEDTP